MAVNYLAHLLLSPSDGEALVGNYLGDFVKGRPEVLRETLPERVVWGIEMHRAVDAFTDGHAAFTEARMLLAPERRRFAGIVVDVMYDYFLAERWGEFCEWPLDEFIKKAYDGLEKEKKWMSLEAQRVFGLMKNENWLLRYTTREGLEKIFQQISCRRDFLKPVATVMEDFEENEEGFRQSFALLYPALQKMVVDINGR